MPPRVPPASAAAAGPTRDLNRHERAAQLLEKAAASPGAEPSVLYLLFLAYKRLNRLTDARNTLRKIARPDANVLLQLGLLSLAEGNLDQAEGELARARPPIRPPTRSVTTCC